MYETENLKYGFAVHRFEFYHRENDDNGESILVLHMASGAHLRFKGEEAKDVLAYLRAMLNN